MIVLVLEGFAKSWLIAKGALTAALGQHLGIPEPVTSESQFGDLRVALTGTTTAAVTEAAHLYLDFAHVPYRIEETP